jgi:hypothetical protein
VGTGEAAIGAPAIPDRLFQLPAQHTAGFASRHLASRVRVWPLERGISRRPDMRSECQVPYRSGAEAIPLSRTGDRPFRPGLRGRAFFEDRHDTAGCRDAPADRPGRLCSFARTPHPAPAPGPGHRSSRDRGGWSHSDGRRRAAGLRFPPCYAPRHARASVSFLGAQTDRALLARADGEALSLHRHGRGGSSQQPHNGAQSTPG